MTKIIKFFGIFLILTCLQTYNALAKKLELIPTSHLGGPQGIFINSIAEITKNSKIETSTKQFGSCGEAVSYFNEATHPVGMIWSDTMIKQSKDTKQNCIVNFEKTTPMAMTFSAFEVCVLKGAEIKPRSILTLGNIKFNPMASQLEHMNGNYFNIKFKNVVYGGSAQVLAGILNREVNVGIIATGNAAAAIKAGTIDCLYSTGSKKYNQKPLSLFAGKNALSEFKLGLILLVKNVKSEDLITLEDLLSKNLANYLDQQEMVGTKIKINKEDLDKFIKTAEENSLYQ